MLEKTIDFFRSVNNLLLPILGTAVLVVVIVGLSILATTMTINFTELVT